MNWELIASVVAVLCVIIRYVGAIVNTIKEAGAQRKLDYWAGKAVTAAEQIYQAAVSKKTDGDPIDRKEYVLEVLAELGYDVESMTVDAAVEAAVRALKKGGITDA